MSSGSRGKPAEKDAVLIAGISGNLGRLLTLKLHGEFPIVGLDARPFDDKPKDVLHHKVDPRRRKAEEIFRRGNLRALVHLGLIHRPARGKTDYRELIAKGTIQLLEYCRRYQVPKVVLVSTAYVYGPHPDNSNFLGEDSPLAGVVDYPEMQALIEWDMYAQSFFWKHPQIETVILRPVHILGSHVRNAPSNYLRLTHPPLLFGFDPMVQMIHEEDFIQAIRLALQPGRRGVFNIVGPGEVPLSRVIKELGKVSIPIPHFLARPLARRLWKMGLSIFPPGELPHLQYPCMVDGALARESLGFRPQHTLRETIRSIL